MECVTHDPKFFHHLFCFYWSEVASQNYGVSVRLAVGLLILLRAETFFMYHVYTHTICHPLLLWLQLHSLDLICLIPLWPEKYATFASVLRSTMVYISTIVLKPCVVAVRRVVKRKKKRSKKACKFTHIFVINYAEKTEV